MAPTEQLAHLLARAEHHSRYYTNGSYGTSRWSGWGRWVLVGVLIAAVIAIFVCLGCVNSRRRRKRGLAPRYGTGWMAGGQKFSQQNNPNAYAPPPPQYTPGPPPDPYGAQYGSQPYGNQQYGNQQYGNQQYGNQQYDNQGYYGGQQEGVQPPPGVYYPPPGGDNPYQPPPGPPPGK